MHRSGPAGWFLGPSFSDPPLLEAPSTSDGPIVHGADGEAYASTYHTSHAFPGSMPFFQQTMDGSEGFNHQRTSEPVNTLLESWDDQIGMPSGVTHSTTGSSVVL